MIDEVKILTFVKCKPYEDIKSISKFFSLSPVEIKECVDDLLRKKFLKEDNFGIIPTERAANVENDKDIVKILQGGAETYKEGMEKIKKKKKRFWKR